MSYLLTPPTSPTLTDVATPSTTPSTFRQLIKNLFVPATPSSNSSSPSLDLQERERIVAEREREVEWRERLIDVRIDEANRDIFARETAMNEMKEQLLIADDDMTVRENAMAAREEAILKIKEREITIFETIYEEMEVGGDSEKGESEKGESEAEEVGESETYYDTHFEITDDMIQYFPDDDTTREYPPLEDDDDIPPASGF